MSLYEYQAVAIRVIDGDTIHARVDLGCNVSIDLTLRLAKINAPELSTPEGRAARDWLIEQLWARPSGVSSGPFTPRRLVVQTIKDHREKYGRYLAHLYPSVAGAKGPSINEAMVAAGQAVPYDGGKR